MTSIQSSLIDLLSTFINGESEISASLNAAGWESLLADASKQTVSGLIWHCLENNKALATTMTIEDKLRWYGNVRIITEQNKNINSVLSEIVRILNEAELPSILLKGQGCASFYPKPEYRSSGDIDLYVGTQRYEEVLECLKTAGLVDFFCHEDIKHTALRCKGVSLELHKYADIIPGHVCNKKFQMALEDCLTVDYNQCPRIDLMGVSVAILPNELNCVYVFIHMFRHFIAGGIRMRQVVDWLMLIRACDKECKIKIEQYLSDFGFLDAWMDFYQMVECYFFHYGSIDKRSERIMELLMRGPNDESKNAKNKISEVLLWYSSYFNAFSLFPRQSVRMLLRGVQNNLVKYCG